MVSGWPAVPQQGVDRRGWRIRLPSAGHETGLLPHEAPEREPVAPAALAWQAGGTAVGRRLQRAQRQHRQPQHCAGAHLHPHRGLRGAPRHPRRGRSAGAGVSRVPDARRARGVLLRAPGDGDPGTQPRPSARLPRKESGGTQEGRGSEAEPPRDRQARTVAPHRRHLVSRLPRAAAPEPEGAGVGRGAEEARFRTRPVLCGDVLAVR